MVFLSPLPFIVYSPCSRQEKPLETQIRSCLCSKPFNGPASHASPTGAKIQILATHCSPRSDPTVWPASSPSTPPGPLWSDRLLVSLLFSRRTKSSPAWAFLVVPSAQRSCTPESLRLSLLLHSGLCSSASPSKRLSLFHRHSLILFCLIFLLSLTQ